MTILRAFLRPARSWIWREPERRAQNLLRFSQTEADGGRDLARAAETTQDPLLRRLFIFHALDEHRHAEMFRARGLALLKEQARPPRRLANPVWLTPGERGADDLRVGEVGDAALLAFLHLSEKSAAEDFAVYRDLTPGDGATAAVFDEILHDEAFHMNYTYAQLGRIDAKGRARHVWRARLGRLWKGYLRLAGAVAGLISGVVLTGLYFVLLPPFAWLARSAQRRDGAGWTAVAPADPKAMRRQY